MYAIRSYYVGSKNPGIQRFVGESGDLGKMLGLDPKWSYNIRNNFV